MHLGRLDAPAPGGERLPFLGQPHLDHLLVLRRTLLLTVELEGVADLVAVGADDQPFLGLGRGRPDAVEGQGLAVGR